MKPVIRPQCLKNFHHRKRPKLQRDVRATSATGGPRARMYPLGCAAGYGRRGRITLSGTRRLRPKPLYCPKIFSKVRARINRLAIPRRSEAAVQIENGKMPNPLGQKLREDHLQSLVGPSLVSASEE